jgi:Zn-finger nucleic acid-binding protein
MNRRNYGRRSGVIVDVCTEHGVWFDFGELSRILAWIRDGGLAHAQQQELANAKEQSRRATTQHWRGAFDEVSPRAPSLATLLERALRALFG